MVSMVQGKPKSKLNFSEQVFLLSIREKKYPTDRFLQYLCKNLRFICTINAFVMIPSLWYIFDRNLPGDFNFVRRLHYFSECKEVSDTKNAFTNQICILENVLCQRCVYILLYKVSTEKNIFVARVCFRTLIIHGNHKRRGPVRRIGTKNKSFPTCRFIFTRFI